MGADSKLVRAMEDCKNGLSSLERRRSFPGCLRRPQTLQACWNSLYKTRQVNIRLGKDSSRLVRLLVLTDQSELSKESLTKLATEYPRLMVQKINKDNISNNKLLYMYKGSYVLFDPLGNGILLYRSNLTGGELLEDLKKLLKNSKIG